MCDGNYSRTLPLRSEKADTLVYLDLPRSLCLWRVIWRRATNHGRTRPDMTEGCPERLDLLFLKWIWTFPRHSAPGLTAFFQAFPAGSTGFAPPRRSLSFAVRWRPENATPHWRNDPRHGGSLPRRGLKIAVTVENAQKANIVLIIETIENDVSTDDELANSRQNVISRRAGQRIGFKLPPAVLDLVDQPVCRRRALGRQVPPYLDQVLVGAGRSLNLCHPA